jgi:Fe-S cluster biogenesis protein NfuA
MDEIKIQAEPKDDQTCRFTVDKPVYPDGSIYFGAKAQAAGSPLAEKIFAIDTVESVMVQDSVVTVSAASGGNWMPIAKQVGTVIREVLASDDTPIAEDALSALPDTEEIKKRIQSVLDGEINPAVAAHGGWVELIDVKKNEVFIKMGGGCQGCGMADVTLKQGVEKSIRQAVPEIGAIMDTTDHATGRNPYYAPSK